LPDGKLCFFPQSCFIIIIIYFLLLKITNNIAHILNHNKSSPPCGIDKLPVAVAPHGRSSALIGIRPLWIDTRKNPPNESFKHVLESRNPFGIGFHRGPAHAPTTAVSVTAAAALPRRRPRCRQPSGVCSPSRTAMASFARAGPRPLPLAGGAAECSRAGGDRVGDEGRGTAPQPPIVVAAAPGC